MRRFCWLVATIAVLGSAAWAEDDSPSGVKDLFARKVLDPNIPLLEVLPEYQGRGIGAELVRRMLEELQQLYMIDLLCDEDVQPFYERFEMRRAQGMFIRNYDRLGAE